jgi:MFS transporter, DHA3 family, macrolide efflux protein
VTRSPPAWSFPVILSGETISVLGSALAGYAISIFSFQQTHSVTSYSMISLAAILPSLLIAPFAGQWVDRLPRKRVMLLANGVSAVLTTLVALVATSPHLALWHIGVLSALNAIASTFHVVAFEAATTMLVSPQRLARASGAAQTGLALAHLLAPAAAGALIVAMSFAGVLALDAASFVIAVVAIAIPTIPEPTTHQTPHDERALLFGLRYVWQRPGLFGTLVVQSVMNFAMGMATVLLLPLVVALASPTAFGLVMSAAGLGMLTGGLAIAASGGPRKRVTALGLGGLLMSLALLFTGVIHVVWGLAVSAFVVGLSVPMVNSATQVIWQTKVPPELQGRIFATRQVLVGAMLPLALLLAGPLSDGIFEPAMLPGGALSGTLGLLVGTGEGRGVAVILSLMGVLTLAVTIWARLNRHVHEVESELPDAAQALTT